MAVLAELIGATSDLITMFQPKEPTPAEQKAKAGVWYNMLRDFVANQRTPEKLAELWRDQLPFAQKSTKQRFMENNIIGRDEKYITNVLVGKINDELVKGGFASLSKSDILSGMGVSDTDAGGDLQTSVINAGARAGDISDLGGQPLAGEVNEGRIYFYVGGLLLAIAGIFVWLFWKPKTRRR